MLLEVLKMVDFWLSVIIFLAVYTFIIVEKVHRTVIALVGATLVVALGLLSQEQAFRQYIDFNTLGLLIGMMIIVGITRRSGVFGYLAVKAAKVAKGRPVYILVALGLITAVLSALLDNVTTVLLIVPVTFVITDRLDISPLPFLFTEILASNIGGTSTLIGDPPNIMIGSATGLGFLDFAANLALPALVILLVTIFILARVYGGRMKSDEEKIRGLLELDEKEFIKDYTILKRSMLILALTMMGFFLHQALHLESATIALLGAAFLMLITGEEPEEILLMVEWPTIFFFAGLFVIVGALDANGVIKALADGALQLSEGNLVLTGILILWMAGIASAFVDNIPFVATMIPLLQTIGQVSGMPMESLWWALALGACLGGNGTLVGASANITVAGIAERHGYGFTFRDYFKVGFPLMILSLMIATAYMYLFFWM
jgi:Na+/H+ antiporter NhaD/arsenite permease-like protein